MIYTIEDNKILVVEFGRGTLITGLGHYSLGKSESLLLRESENINEIGEKIENGFIEPQIILSFRNKKGLNHVIEQLEKIRSNFEIAETLDNE